MDFGLHNCHKNETVWFYNAVGHPKDAEGNANIVGPNQTVP